MAISVNVSPVGRLRKVVSFSVSLGVPETLADLLTSQNECVCYCFPCRGPQAQKTGDLFLSLPLQD